jgi:cytochrome P450
MLDASCEVIAPAASQRRHAAAPRRAPPVVGARAVLGSLSSVLRSPLDFLVEQRARHGDVYALDLGGTRMILLNHPRHAQHVYRDHHASYGKTGPFWDLVRTLFGGGLPVSEGESWRRQRRMIQPQFHRERVPVLIDPLARAVRDRMARWDALADAGEPVNLASELRCVAMQAIVRVIFGAELDPRDADEIGSEVGYAFDFMLRGMLFTSLPPWLPVPGRRRYRTAIRTIDRHIVRLVAQRRRRAGDATDLLGALMASVDAETGTRMSDAQLRDEVVAMFLAGYETVASMLTFAIDLLARHPVHARAARDQILEVVGEREPELADLPRLGATLAILQEALRLVPPVFFLPRQARVDDEIDGFAIPAGTIVAPVVYVIHRHPDVWEHPERFDPGRFTAPRASGRHRLAWMPFGAGQRQCPGKDVALLEGQILLARILQRYELTPVSATPPRVHLGATARPGDEVQIRLERLQRK